MQKRSGLIRRVQIYLTKRELKRGRRRPGFGSRFAAYPKSFWVGTGLTVLAVGLGLAVGLWDFVGGEGADGPLFPGQVNGSGLDPGKMGFEDPSLALAFQAGSPGDRIRMIRRIFVISEPDDMPRAAALAMDPVQDELVRFEALNLLARSGYRRLADDLIEILGRPHDKDPFRPGAAARLWICWHEAAADQRGALKQRIVPVFRGLLQDPDYAVRGEALLALVRMRDPVGELTAISWLEASDEGDKTVRDAAIRCVARELDLREHIQAIRACAEDPNPAVRLSAVEALGRWRDGQSRGAFEKAADSDDPRLKEAGRAALKRLER